MNILDYLAWRGDLSFNQDGFNHVDNLVLCYLAYVKFDGFVRKNEAVNLKEVCDSYFVHHSEKEIEQSTSFISMAPLVLKACANCNRYKNTLIANYVSETDTDENKQFSAVHFKLDNGLTYIAYRGTDDSVVGWREDFMISYTLTKAQIRASEYLNQTVNPKEKYIVGGHSKGGLLAYYAVSKANKEIQDAIELVYSNDGPGLSDELFDSEQFASIKDKYIKIVPEFAIVGQLFNHQNKLIIIKSKATGVLQHNGMCWQVLGNNFIYCKNLDKNSCTIIKVVNDFLSNASDEEREIFTNGIFDALDMAGVRNITDFSSGGLPLIIKTIKELGDVDESVKHVTNKLLKSLSNEAGYQAKQIIEKINPFKDKIKKIDK